MVPPDGACLSVQMKDAIGAACRTLVPLRVYFASKSIAIAPADLPAVRRRTAGAQGDIGLKGEYRAAFAAAEVAAADRAVECFVPC